MGADYRNDGGPEESSRHFVDVERYDRELFSRLEMDVEGLVLQFGLDETWKNGTGPWSAEQTFDRLVEAFRRQDLESILLHFSDLCHYVADLHQPLHTTENFDGQLTGQPDIHAQFETGLLNRHVSRIAFNRMEPVDLEPVLPVLLEVVLESHQEVETVLGADDRIVSELALDRQAYRRRGERRSCPDRYFERMSEELGGFLAERLNQAAHRVASLWRMVWEQAGEPEF